MPIDLDNISFYSHPPTKHSSSSITPASCWTTYQTPIAPYTLPFIPPSVGIQNPTRDTAAPNAGSKFDLEIGRVMRENGLGVHNVNYDMHLDSGVQSETEKPRSEQPSLTSGCCDRDLVVPLLFLTLSEVPISSPVSSTLAPSDLPTWRRDSVFSLGGYHEPHPAPALSQVGSTCLHISPPPSLDMPAQPSMDSTNQEESKVDDTDSRPENRQDRMEVLESGMKTQRFQAEGSSSSEACPDKGTAGGSIEKTQTPASPSRHRELVESKNQKPLRLELAPFVHDKMRSLGGRKDYKPLAWLSLLVEATTLLEAPTRVLQPDRDTAIVEAATAVTRIAENGPRSSRKDDGYSLSSKCCSASIPGDTQEIYGRGILRMQAHGPRQVYFMTFLPDVSHHPPMASSAESPFHDESSENKSSKPGVQKEHRKRILSPGCDDGEAWSNRSSPSFSPSLAPSSQSGRSSAKPKTSRRVRWSPEEKKLLRELKRDGSRPWSERGQESICIYHPAPLSQRLGLATEDRSSRAFRTPGTSSYYARPRCHSVPASKLSVFKANTKYHPARKVNDFLLEATRERVTDSNATLFSTQGESIYGDQIALVAEILQVLRDFNTIRNLLATYYSTSQASIIPSQLILSALPSLSESVLSLSNGEGEGNDQLSRLAEEVLISTSSQINVTALMSPSEFMHLYTGENLRLEFLGVVFSVAARSCLIGLAQEGEQLDAFARDLYCCSTNCLRLARELTPLNDMLVWLGQDHLMLTACIEGDSSK
ncbi:hypothetical protein N7468_004156 [Penicillium chermesinum]|uniref:Myb-like domain-containing protein n=1 Tax=Penicillium chermesinum TaxID=63820 RepID=A0A9W9P830_9EURO|nr:uncharacterized protein N7468_004156 [Penicillium chermesinum]KAJ5239537.1 hypothetical protein N7468_004156 [Penicillium chermesinum]